MDNNSSSFDMNKLDEIIRLMKAKLKEPILQRIKFYENPLLVVEQQHRFPRSKKKRIRKKWRKRFMKWIPDPNTYRYYAAATMSMMLPEPPRVLCIIGHPVAIAKLKRQVREIERNA